MFPDWPESDADLVPLPRCDGPKLKPFDFRGPQNIEFLDYLGEGLHSHVFKVQINGHIYALKLFRFVDDSNGLGQPVDQSYYGNLHMMSGFYDYSDPFSCECRAFGRLQETTHEELAIKCFGYLLLDEKHEEAMMTRFHSQHLDFNGDIYEQVFSGAESLRSYFPGRGGRPRPIRGIVKEFGQGIEEQNMTAADVRKMLRDITMLQQLGIFRIDPGSRQIINGKICDFSTSISVPHYLTNPELNPHLTPKMVSAMELETFKIALSDYLELDDETDDWNRIYGKERGVISVSAFPGWRGSHLRNSLRSGAAGVRVSTFVDPRKYDWRAGHSQNAGSTKRIRLTARPRAWYYHCDTKLAETLMVADPFEPSIKWDHKGGHFFPRLEELKEVSE